MARVILPDRANKKMEGAVIVTGAHVQTDADGTMVDIGALKTGMTIYDPVTAAVVRIKTVVKKHISFLSPQNLGLRPYEIALQRGGHSKVLKSVAVSPLQTVLYDALEERLLPTSELGRLNKVGLELRRVAEIKPLPPNINPLQCQITTYVGVFTEAPCLMKVEGLLMPTYTITQVIRSVMPDIGPPPGAFRTFANGEVEDG